MYSPFPDATGVVNNLPPARTCWASLARRSWPLFTAARKISLVVFGVADLRDDDAWSL